MPLGQVAQYMQEVVFGLLEMVGAGLLYAVYWMVKGQTKNDRLDK